MIRKKTLHYNEGVQAFEGNIYWEDSKPGKKPGVLIAHAFGGQSEFEWNKAIELAKLGYVGFAIDLYGKGKRASSNEEAQALMNELDSNRELLLKRMQLSLNTLMIFEQVDNKRIGAIGFCFGGKCVLDLARSGADIRGVVSFHGLYDKPSINHESPVKAAILVLHGWDDPLAPPDQTVELAKELTQRKANWQLLSFENTGHAFTNPKAQFPEKGMFYHALSSRRGWRAMVHFFLEVFEGDDNDEE